MEPEELREYEELCEATTSHKNPKSDSARRFLDSLGVDPRFFYRAKAILEVTSNKCAQYYALLTIRKILATHFKEIPLSAKADLKSLYLRILYSTSFGVDILKATMQGLAEILVAGWLDDPIFPAVLSELKSISEISGHNLMVTLAAYECIVNEMAEPGISKGENLRKYKKVRAVFKEQPLRDILSFSLKAMNESLQKFAMYPAEVAPLLTQSLRLINACFAFDFSGRGEEPEASQIPLSWNCVVLDQSLTDPVFVVVLGKFDESLKVSGLKVIGELCYLRQTFFKNMRERQKYFKRITPQLFTVMEECMTSPTLYKEALNAFYNFSVVFKFKDIEAAQLADKLVSVWGNFALNGIKKKYGFFRQSLILLKIWINVLKECNGSLVHEKAMDSCEAFLRKFVEKTLKTCMKIVSNEDIENVPYEASELAEGEYKGLEGVFEELGRISVYCDRDIVLSLMHEKLKSNIEMYVGGMQNKNQRILECRIAWLINLLASFINVKNFGVLQSSLDPKEIDACAAVFKLIDFTFKLYSQQYAVEEYLELAFIRFCGGFRKEALSEFQKTSVDEEEFGADESPYSALEAVLRLSNLGPIAEIVFRKLITNLTVHSRNRRIIELTLSALQNLTSVPSITRKLLPLPSIQSLLQNHVGILNTMDNIGKQQSDYYTFVATLVFSQETNSLFTPFIKFLDYPLQSIASTTTGSSTSPSEVRKVFSVLLGVLKCVRNPTQFAEFFEWFYPEHFSTIKSLVNLYPSEYELHKTVLKFFREITSNQTHRLKLETLTGFITFKCICPILFDIIKSSTLNQKQEEQFSSLKLLMEILMNCLTGRYVHFGLLELYNDRCFIDLSLYLFKVILSLNLTQVTYFPKFHKTLYHFFQDFFGSHMEHAVRYLSAETINSVLVMLSQGITSQNSSVVIAACSSLDSIVEFLANEVTKSKSRLFENVMKILKTSEKSLLKLTEELLRAICYDDSDYMYSVVGPMYSLIWLEKRLFQEAKRVILEREENVEVKTKLNNALDQFIGGVEFNLDPVNRDKLLTNYIRFKAIVREFV